jgi:hypothetical protein
MTLRRPTIDGTNETKTMTSTTLTWGLAACASALALAGAFTAHATEPARPPTAALTAPALAEQTDRAGGITVKVTPRKRGRDAPVWEFAVVLDTHSQDLSQDLTRSAVLVDRQGKRYPPLAWEGAGPGGHHREGVLKFKPLAPEADAVVLELSGIGSAMRTFRWQLK